MMSFHGNVGFSTQHAHAHEGESRQVASVPLPSPKGPSDSALEGLLRYREKKEELKLKAGMLDMQAKQQATVT